MLGIKLGYYWKFTWGLLIPFTLLFIFFYSVLDFKVLSSGGYIYPSHLIGR